MKRLHKTIKSEAEQKQYFTEYHNRFKQASEVAGSNKHYFSIAGSKVCVDFAGDKMTGIMTPALEHLRIDAVDKPDLTLCVWDTESTGIKAVPHPVGIEDFTDRGDIWGFYSQRYKTAFHWSDFSINIMDLERGIGLFWVETTARFPYYVFSSPLRTLLHWWMESKGLQLVHAAAVGTEDGAVLITGKGGIGKSTSALTCLKDGMFYLSDDYIIIGLHPVPYAFSLYNTAKINACDLEKFPGFSKMCINPEKLSHEKAVMHLFPSYKNLIKEKMPLKAIMLPEVHSKKESSLSPVEFWKLQRAMGFTTMSQLPNVGKQTHIFLTGLIKKLPCYKLKAGKDLIQIPKLLKNYLNNPEKYISTDKTKRDDITTGWPLVSVIIPVYNGEKYIREAIENLIAQDYPALEILIINDGSTDDTDGVVKKAQEELGVDIRYFYYGNDGPAFARNRGIRDASGDFIAFLDADDLYPPDNIKYLVSYLMNNPEIEIVRGYAQMMELDKKSGKFIEYGNPEESYPAYIGAALYRKEVFRKVGLFDATMRFAEDSDWYMRAVELEINMKWLDKVTLKVRRHGENMTEGKDLVELNTLVVFKKALDRMRRGESKY